MTNRDAFRMGQIPCELETEGALAHLDDAFHGVVRVRTGCYVRRFAPRGIRGVLFSLGREGFLGEEVA